MARIAVILLCLSCSLAVGYRKKRQGHTVVAHDPEHLAVDSNEKDAAALLERGNDAGGARTKSLNLEQSALGKNPRRRHPPRRRRAPVSTYNVIGSGKCLSCGQDPRHIYKHGNGHQCEQLCQNEGTCCAYSVSGYNNCLLWTQCEGLTADGADWAGAKCHVKPGFENIPCPTPEPTLPPTSPPTLPPTPPPTAEPEKAACPDHVEVNSKTQECITYTADWEERVVDSGCCSPVAEQLVDDGTNDADEDDVVVQEPEDDTAKTARSACSARPCGQCSLPCHVRYSEIPSGSQECATCDEPPSVCAQRSWSQCTHECKRTYTEADAYSGCVESSS